MQMYYYWCICTSNNYLHCYIICIRSVIPLSTITKLHFRFLGFWTPSTRGWRSDRPAIFTASPSVRCCPEICLTRWPITTSSSSARRTRTTTLTRTTTAPGNQRSEFFKKICQLQPLFVFLFFSHNNSITNIQIELFKLKKHRWCAWDLSLGGRMWRHRRIHWAMVEPQKVRVYFAA